MTFATMSVGLIPILWSTGTGSEIMKRIAAPMVGGIVTSFLLELLVYPAIYAFWRERELDPEADSELAGGAQVDDFLSGTGSDQESWSGSGFVVRISRESGRVPGAPAHLRRAIRQFHSQPAIDPGETWH